MLAVCVSHPSVGDGVSLALVHACVCALPADTRLDWTILGVNAIPFIAPPQCQLTQEQWESRNLCMGKLTLDTKGIAIVHLCMWTIGTRLDLTI